MLLMPPRLRTAGSAAVFHPAHARDCGCGHALSAWGAHALYVTAEAPSENRQAAGSAARHGLEALHVCA
ncbi:MAG: hypothetical protein ACLUI3_04805 [Christensenellales bacterium]